ncbi:MAG: N-acetylmuramoyl-L-alanine amidase [Firmicutes bacterium]|nr:N-acetylmuramoyl-L-alanine amidase [Bacillota bacterium]
MRIIKPSIKIVLPLLLCMAALLVGLYLKSEQVVPTTTSVPGQELSSMTSEDKHDSPDSRDFSRFVVCLDPGHSSDGSDGKAKVNGVTELEINWEVAEKLKRALEERYRVRVVMTRDERDKTVGNRQRAEVANNAHADLFFRLHCDWEATGKQFGFTFYYPAQAGTAEGRTGPSADVMRSSQKAAMSIHSGTAKALNGALTDHGIKTDDSTYIGHSQGGALTGSIFSEIPVVLIEMVYLSNKSDAEFIKSDKGQQVMADSLAEGIVEYLRSVP